MENPMDYLVVIVTGIMALGLLFWVIGSLLGGAADAMTDDQVDINSALKEAQREFAQAAAESTYRDLNLDGLILVGLEKFGDMIGGIRDEMDPLVRLLVCYMFIEELSDNYSEEDSSLAEFSYNFLKEELSEEDFSVNFSDVSLGEGHFETPVFWGNVLQSRIEGSYAQVEEEGAENLKSSLCVKFCADLAEGIDEDLIERFINRARGDLDKLECSPPVQNQLSYLWRCRYGSN